MEIDDDQTSDEVTHTVFFGENIKRVSNAIKSVWGNRQWLKKIKEFFSKYLNKNNLKTKNHEINN